MLQHKCRLHFRSIPINTEFTGATCSRHQQRRAGRQARSPPGSWRRWRRQTARRAARARPPSPRSSTPVTVAQQISGGIRGWYRKRGVVSDRCLSEEALVQQEVRKLGRTHLGVELVARLDHAGEADVERLERRLRGAALAVLRLDGLQHRACRVALSA